MMSSMSFVRGSYPFYISFYAVESHLGSLSASLYLSYLVPGEESFIKKVLLVWLRGTTYWIPG
jgi:hypothetical protein